MSLRGVGTVRRWRYAAAAVLVVVAAVVGWRLLAHDSDSDGRFEVSMIEVRADQYSPTYSSPQWWTDGSTALRFGTGETGLWVGPAGPMDGRRTETFALEADRDLYPEAVAASPDSASAWVSVALDKGADDEPVRVRSWGATTPAEGDEPQSPVEVPVDLDPVSSGDNTITMDLAVAGADQSAVAILVIHQADRTVALASRPGGAWRTIDLPAGPPATTVMSSGSGIVLLADGGRGEKQLWFTGVEGLGDDFADLTWTEVDGVPQDVDFKVGRDGADAATIVWRGGSPQAVRVQVVRENADGTSADLETVVEPATLRGKYSSIDAVLKSGDQWYLAGSVPSEADINIAYAASAPAVWLLADDSWRRLDDRLLANQPDQRFDLLWEDSEERMLGASSSSPLEIDMVWRLDPAD